MGRSSSNTRSGQLIAVEGIDGSGKTTQSYLIVEELRRMGLKAVYTTEPTYNQVGTMLRLRVAKAKTRDPTYEALLFAADRREHIGTEILPKLKEGFVVVSDRYVYSSFAYQSVAGLDIGWIKRINFFAPKPQAVVFLDMQPKKSLRRKKETWNVFEQLENELRVMKAYRRMAKSE
ncbi:MAG: dTMP kinase, partial [Candidatus Bathyarchaeia archaeon]